MKQYKVNNKRHKVPFVVFSESIHKSKMIKATDDGRKTRSKYDVKARKSPLATSSDLPDVERMEYIVKSKPSVEKRTHHGFIDFERKTGIIHSVFCDCNDFAYRLYSPLVKHDLSKWDIPKKYQRRLKFDHNRDWTNITNPKGKIYVCKHIHHMITNYM